MIDTILYRNSDIHNQVVDISSKKDPYYFQVIDSTVGYTLIVESLCYDNRGSFFHVGVASFHRQWQRRNVDGESI